MNKKVSLGTAITLMAIAAALAVAITMVYSIRTFNNKLLNIKEREATYQKLTEINNIVRSQYFGEIDEQVLMDSIARGYVAGIGDKYGAYLNAEQLQKQTDALDGKTVDIGLVTELDPSGYMLVTEVYPESPAENAEIQVGDLIIKVDDLDVTAQVYEEAAAALKGEAGTKVSLVLRRGTEDQPPIDITRRRVEKPTVYSRLIDNVGYVKITEFADATPNQFSKALNALLSEGAKGLVFDIRSNPGGTIPSVSSVLDKLLPAGDIVSATYKDGSTKVLATSDENEVDLPMAVVMNEKSASAAELFAQAIKDYGKGKCVGVTTYGKGLMQTVFKLDDGSALDITVAKYNPPMSPNFDGVGVKPDFEVKLSPEQERVLDDLDETSDPQLRKALELVKSTIGKDPKDMGSDMEDTQGPEEPEGSPGEESSSSSGVIVIAGDESENLDETEETGDEDSSSSSEEEDSSGEETTGGEDETEPETEDTGDEAA